MVCKYSVLYHCLDIFNLSRACHFLVNRLLAKQVLTRAAVLSILHLLFFCLKADSFCDESILPG